MSDDVACRITHAQIKAGTCPRCQRRVGDNLATAGRTQSHAPGERGWDITRMKADLQDHEARVRLVTVQNARSHNPNLPESVEVLRVALDNSVSRVREEATSALALVGVKLDARAAEVYQAESRRVPDDLAIRILMLGYLVCASRIPEYDPARSGLAS
jgi:hypothetical protein